MGCCLTTTAAVNHRQPPKPHPPPPPPLPEETVKEVLSETPIIPKPPLTNRPLPNRELVDVTENLTVEVQENVSEVSEMYSYSESFSAATTATTITTTAADGKKEEIEVDDGEVTQKVKNKSPPAKRVVRKRPVGNSGEFPARKERGDRPVARRHVAPSPERKRQSPARTTTNTQMYRNVGPGNDSRREGAARRSRSPAVRGEACQRRKVGEKSGIEKVGGVAPVVGSDGKSMVEKGGDAVEKGGETVAETETETEVQASESLENPLVSLECFIFL